VQAGGGEGGGGIDRGREQGKRAGQSFRKKTLFFVTGREEWGGISLPQTFPAWQAREEGTSLVGQEPEHRDQSKSLGKRTVDSKNFRGGGTERRKEHAGIGGRENDEKRNTRVRTKRRYPPLRKGVRGKKKSSEKVEKEGPCLPSRRGGRAISYVLGERLSLPFSLGGLASTHVLKEREVCFGWQGSSNLKTENYDFLETY